MNAIPISTDSLKDLYGESFYLLEGELDDVANENVPAEGEAKAQKPEKPEAQMAVAEKTEEKPVEKTTEKSPEKAISKEATKPPANAKPGIVWRVKPTSKVLFIISKAEWSNSTLTDLLKKIVASLEIPFELAGFGLIEGPVQAAEFDQMPQKYGVVFDAHVVPFTDNPEMYNGNEVFFSHKLDLLKDNKEMKMELWGYLKQLKEKIN